MLTTPETLGMEETQELLAQSGVSPGRDRRGPLHLGVGLRLPAFLPQIGARLRDLGSPAGAGADRDGDAPKVREAIIESLGMREPTIVADSPHRSNLAFEVLKCEGEVRPRVLLRADQETAPPRHRLLFDAARGRRVYTLLKRFRIPAYRYHGGMTRPTRHRSSSGFMKPRHRRR